MIYRIECEKQLAYLPSSGVEANKIRALFLAYGLGYDFCRFYRQDDIFVSSLDGSFVLCGDNADVGELSAFLRISGFSDVFCSEKLGRSLSADLGGRSVYVHLMKYNGDDYSCELSDDTALSDVYKILGDSFDIEFEPWYLDMSHRIRHGISRCYTADGCSTVTVQHNINGEALISQVATLQAERGKGRASALLKSVCTLLRPSDVFVLCEDKLVPFYKNVGFVSAGKKCIILP